MTTIAGLAPAQELAAKNLARFPNESSGYRIARNSLLAVGADPGQDPRGAPVLMSLWTILDSTSEGRGFDWYPKLDDEPGKLAERAQP